MLLFLCQKNDLFQYCLFAKLGLSEALYANVLCFSNSVDVLPVSSSVRVISINTIILGLPSVMQVTLYGNMLHEGTCNSENFVHSPRVRVSL